MSAAPSAMAEFLDAEQAAVIERFVERVRESVAPAALSHTQLVDHLPQFLREVSAALREDVSPSRALHRKSPAGEEHGSQRLQVGYNLKALVREYGFLRDSVYERMEQLGTLPTLREMRIFADCVSAATSDAVEQFVEERDARREVERDNLLAMFQQAPGFVSYLSGPQLVTRLANAAFHQLVGHRDLLGRPLREALPEVEGQGYFELLDEVYRSGQPFVGRAMRVELQREPGAPLSAARVDFVYQPVVDDDGAVTGIIIQGHDVTELHREGEQRALVEQALRDSEQRYRTLFQSIDDGYCLMQLIFDGDTPVDYRFLETNAAFESHTGLVDAVGKTALELVPGLDASWFQLYGNVALTGEARRFENHAAVMEDRWFEVFANRVGDPSLRQVALVFKDISERKRVERERERLLALESEARREAERASTLKDDFLATLSHELRTPLHSMLGWVHLLRAGSLPPEKHARALETIDRNARSQAQLIDDLLDVSRILAGKLRLDPSRLDVQAVVDAAIETVRPAAEAKAVSVETTSAATALQVMGDAGRLQQVVWNLLSNAVKFTPRGGRVQVLVEALGGNVEITVADTGRGIDSAFAPHVFERFRQQEAGSTRAHGGLGLGLSIVRQLVELHGGVVRVFSAGAGRGSSFTVCLPLAQPLPGERATPTPAQGLERSDTAGVPDLAASHVIVVDDESDAREMLRATLEACGARVSIAASAEECLRLFGSDRPDLLLSDIGMPGEDGYTLIERVRKLPAELGGNVPAVALTAYARLEDRTRALISGFSYHVPKPVDPTELLAVVTTLLGRVPRR